MGYTFGGALLAFGIGGLVSEPDLNLVDWASWFVGAALFHDAIIAPCVLLAGLATTRLPRPYRPYVQRTLMVSAIVTLVALPFVLGKGKRADNPSILPLPYVRNLLLVLAAIYLVAACVAVWHYRTHARTGRKGSDDDRRA
ncbi:hypothetical protein GCM10022254_55330 [Actinomadura meridiana]|uniref:Lipoprotein n=1 Tax=Actinomadura meridiana TaxID=559626 RepID=A0ABP8CFG9_9ACTN